MKFLPTISILFLLIACQNAKTEKTVTATTENSTSENAEYILIFASCNDQDREQPLWKPILSHQPDLFVWGGDNVYADTDDMAKMKSDYDKVKAHPDYKELMERTIITGTWDIMTLERTMRGVNGS